MAHNLSTTFNGSFMSQRLHEGSDDDSTVDWETFSFEKELEERKDASQQYFKKYKSLSEDIDIDEISNVQENSKNILESIYIEMKNRQQNFKNILFDFEAVRNEHKKTKENIELLKSKVQNLEKSVETLKSEESSVSSEYKQDKVSYKKAINIYKTNTDLDIDIKDNLGKCTVKFNSLKHEVPILVSVDKDNKSIIDFSCSELPSSIIKGEPTTCANTPALICSLREHFIKNNKK